MLGKFPNKEEEGARSWQWGKSITQLKKKCNDTDIIVWLMEKITLLSFKKFFIFMSESAPEFYLLVAYGSAGGQPGSSGV